MFSKAYGNPSTDVAELATTIRLTASPVVEVDQPISTRSLNTQAYPTAMNRRRSEVRGLGGMTAIIPNNREICPATFGNSGQRGSIAVFSTWSAG
ncbi:hypothetical protein OOU_Y34scaffold00666g121 [Pyricularia oryzae Y34]|uniref:Uncharacterized protein n=3 Tax=Pyricularia oryzae TaxID=318829 RepID=Q2KGC4_PYRO7|nr:hypothetical protein MGCH7_ch7g411 [Pyricularia oryzae 70-15]ELQ36260.1 hypothetical protein OOU_Y34scaffold00666g121 [Pyricularia oryzae Y34]